MGLFCNHREEITFLRSRVSDLDDQVRKLTTALLESNLKLSTQLVALSNPAATRELERTERPARHTDAAPARPHLPGYRPNYRPASPVGGATPPLGPTLTTAEQAETVQALEKYLGAKN